MRLCAAPPLAGRMEHSLKRYQGAHEGGHAHHAHRIELGLEICADLSCMRHVLGGCVKAFVSILSGSVVACVKACVSILGGCVNPKGISCTAMLPGTGLCCTAARGGAHWGNAQWTAREERAGAGATRLVDTRAGAQSEGKMLGCRARYTVRVWRTSSRPAAQVGEGSFFPICPPTLIRGSEGFRGRRRMASTMLLHPTTGTRATPPPPKASKELAFLAFLRGAAKN